MTATLERRILRLEEYLLRRAVAKTGEAVEVLCHKIESGVEKAAAAIEAGKSYDPAHASRMDRLAQLIAYRRLGYDLPGDLVAAVQAEQDNDAHAWLRETERALLGGPESPEWAEVFE